MILANRIDGTTLKCDLANGADRTELFSSIRAGKVTALSILSNGSRYSLPSPTKFSRPLVFSADLLSSGDKVFGERISVQADNVRVSVSLLYSDASIRVDLVKTGRMQYNPMSG